MKNITNKLKKIKILLTDVDGVLTDGGMYYSASGDVMKKFHVRDGMGISLLKKNGIPTVIVTKEKSAIVKKWAKNMPVAKLYGGITKKEEILPLISKEFKVKPYEMAFIGDDVNDLKLLIAVGFSAMPNDGIKALKKICDYQCKTSGGNGVLREITELIFAKRFLNIYKSY